MVLGIEVFVLPIFYFMPSNIGRFGYMSAISYRVLRYSIWY